MTWVPLVGGTTATAAALNSNFQHMMHESPFVGLKPMYGPQFALDDDRLYSLGSRRYHYSTLHLWPRNSFIIQLRKNLYVDAGASIKQDGHVLRGGVTLIDEAVSPSLPVFHAAFAATRNVVVQPTTSGILTITASTGLDTSGTTTAYRIFNLAVLRHRTAEGDTFHNSDDLVYWVPTSAATPVYAELQMAAFNGTGTSASTQTATFYYEFISRKF